MKRLLPCLVVLLTALGAGPGAMAQQPPPVFDEFRPLPLHQAARRVSERYQGRLLAAHSRPPHPHERELGVALVYEFRVITPRRQMLLIRMDARDGRFLEVAGRGQFEALRKGGRQPNGD